VVGFSLLSARLESPPKRTLTQNCRQPLFNRSPRKDHLL
jgi:hypothetical protein